MKEIIENLWSEYFEEKCAEIHTEEEKALIKKTAEMREHIDALLTKEQGEPVEKYLQVLYEFQGVCVKKAFFKGCEFAMSFLFELEI